MAVSWPPTLEELKNDMRREADDTRDDDALQDDLDAAVAFVERIHDGEINFDQDDPYPDPCLDDVDADLKKGTLRLAARWRNRVRSPDGLVTMSELGSTRVPSFDPDIDRMLRIGLYRNPVTA